MPTTFMAMATARGSMLVTATRLGSNMAKVGRERTYSVAPVTKKWKAAKAA